MFDWEYDKDYHNGSYKCRCQFKKYASLLIRLLKSVRYAIQKIVKEIYMNSTPRKSLRPKKSAADLLDMYHLEARSYLLETAAILDRIERSDGGAAAMEDSRIDNLFKICRLLTQEKGNRAEKLLQLLSV